MVLVLLDGTARVLPASAHAELLRSEPEAGAVLLEPPAAIRLWFSAALDQGSTVTVVGEGFVPAGHATASIEPATATSMQVSLGPLAPGDYTVQYRALAANDRHAVEGSFAFRIVEDETLAASSRAFDGGAAALAVALVAALAARRLVARRRNGATVAGGTAGGGLP